ncbi:copper chaperone PCu(A)C [Gluconacetobacter diazotrophicus]|uniref:Copper chaperone PCu(A)C n=1 Tax=Gluconacetobacter diazotrophicus TaxID=33996 RepID=A0A7W4FDU4_GLUDI|nr:copper chaperone PCu(A)C [Gluconacetobacter diazotrophicus]MBB2155889.1 copper chaperone PCu(A)C [Gluconacetobacter diazotrophicus]
MKRRVLPIGLFALLAGLSPSVPALADTAMADPAPPSIPGQVDADGDIDIRAAWMQVIRPDHRIAAGYFTIENRGRNVHLLDGVSSPACHDMFAHHTEQESTQETATLFSHLALPAQTILVFPPGGYHLVCVGYDDSVQPGRRVPVTFHFMGGTTRTIQFDVRPAPDTADTAP